MTNGYDDYIEKDSSIWSYPELSKAITEKDGSLRFGIVRSVQKNNFGTISYRVECWKDGTTVSVTCNSCVTRFGGAHNFEEYGIRPYYPKGVEMLIESGTQYDSYALKSGDNVLVAAMGGDWREGVIIGGVGHNGRASDLEAGQIAYRSCFNGLDTEIRDDGTYLMTWNGKAINDALLDVPPYVGVEPPAPVYDFFTAGSYMGFDTNGSFTVSDANGQLIKIKKSTGNISIASGLNRIEIGSSDIVGNDDSIGIQTSELSVTTTDVIDIFSLDSIAIQGFQEGSIKGIKVAMGNDVFELIAGLIELIDTIGELQVTSPVGPCNPLNSTLSWVKIELLKAKMSTLQGDLVDASNTLTSIVIDEDNLTGGLI